MIFKSFKYLIPFVLFFCLSSVVKGQFELIKSSLTILDFGQEDYDDEDLDAYLQYIINENTYQDAFSNLSNSSFRYNFDLRIEGLKNQDLVKYDGTGSSFDQGSCRRNEIKDREIRGEYYRRNYRPKFFTAKLLESFLSGMEPLCNEEDRNETRVQELIEVLMNPGSVADLQFIGYKTDLFSSEMSQYYNYKLSKATYDTTVDCIVFEMNLKPEFRERKKKKTIIKSLRAYYNKNNNRTIAKEVVVSYKTPLQNYDVNFLVEFATRGSNYFPKKIKYEGIWAVMPHRTEIGTFIIEYHKL